MNIFVLDSDPQSCAAFHNDRHVVKMILESCQLLSTAHRVNDGVQFPSYSENGRKVTRWKLSNSILNDKLYQSTHTNHPCAIWCRESLDNYMWLWKLTIALAQEYTYRYKKTHKCERDGLIGVLHTPPSSFNIIGWSSPAQAMPESCQSNDVIQAYRTYYKTHKQHLAKWTNRNIPEWW